MAIHGNFRVRKYSLFSNTQSFQKINRMCGCWHILLILHKKNYFMHPVDIIVLIAVASFAGFRIYQKYFKKEIPGEVKRGGTSFGTTEGEDYEPYSKK